MKNRNRLTILLLCGYCIPFSFLAMFGDAQFGTMWLYVLLIAGTGFLCCGAVKLCDKRTLLFGNTLSAIVSILFVNAFKTPEWEYYFKPFSPLQLVLLISAVIFMLQLYLWWVLTDSKRKNPET